MKKIGRVYCPICNWRLFDTDSNYGMIEIKCSRCSSVVNIPLFNLALAGKKQNKRETSK